MPRLGEPRLDVESCESTQLLVDTSLPEGALVVADHQTAGRGRLGRSWEAPAGAALLFSILLKPPPEPPAPQLSLVAGIAVADALERTLGLSVQLKWPNDVMLRRKKVAGCLAERKRIHYRCHEEKLRQKEKDDEQNPVAQRARERYPYITHALIAHVHGVDRHGLRPTEHHCAREHTDQRKDDGPE